ncbi:MAG: EF-hand domain-containing protein [Sphingomicrobium sp.]
MPIPLVILLAAVAGQAKSATPPPPPPAPTRHWGRIFISPMGEPFRAERGGDALEMWFQQADRNHDGYLTLQEMQQDSERFFATLDVNRDGEIDPDEIARYESVVAPEIGDGRETEEDIAQGHRGAARFGLLDLPEPVASADADFDRGVSLAEFRQAAAKRFAALDIDHQGRLTLAALELIRPAAEPEEHKPDSSDAPTDVEPQP